MGTTPENENYVAEDLNKKDREKAEHELLMQAHRDVRNWYDYFQTSNNTFREDLNFVFMDQWNSKDRANRQTNQKATLQFNFIYTIITQLLGEQRQNTPNPIVRATKANIPQQEVDLRDDLLRQTFYESNVDVVIQNAFMYSLSAGYGAWVVELEYKHPKTFQLAAKVRELKDPRQAFWDPKAVESDKSDGDYSGYFTDHTVEDFKMTWPKAKSNLSFAVENNFMRDDMMWWNVGQKIRVCHIWVKEYYHETIVKLSTGEEMSKEDALEQIALHKKLMAKLKKAARLGANIPPEFMQNVEITQEKDALCYKIRNYAMVDDKILEVRDWPSQHLPIVFLDCQSFFQDGVQYIQSFHKFAQDQQRFLNYVGSEAAESMLNAHNGNWIGTPGNVKGKLMELWKNPQRNKGILLADYDSKGNLPQYIQPPKISADYAEQFALGLQNIQQLVGRYETNRGADSNDSSGKALGIRANLGNQASFVPFDNCKRAVAQTARIMVSLMPAIYDETGDVVVRGKDGKERTVGINQPSINGTYKNDMSLEHFDVSIEAGSNFAMQREAELALLQNAMSIAPQLAPNIMDKYMSLLDIENAPEMVDRIQDLMLGTPIAQIISKETGKPIAQHAPPPPDPRMLAVQQKMQQAQMENQTKIAQQQIDEQKLQLQSQQMVQDAINDHAKNVIDVTAMNKKLQADAIRSETELRANHVKTGTDFAKHLLSLHANKNQAAQRRNDS